MQKRYAMLILLTISKPMKKNLYILLIIGILSGACSKTGNQQSFHKADTISLMQMPKVLFITTGVNLETEVKDLPQSINIAIQNFNKNGIPVRLEPRDVLFDKTLLQQYPILILSTAKNIHDADRKYSLTYMTDEELEILKDYVQNGGTLILGDNVGRNYFDGTDRILQNGKLDSLNYPLSEVLGYEFAEKNMKDFEIIASKKIAPDSLWLEKQTEDLWTLAPSKKHSKHISALANWANNDTIIPAVFQNHYGKGTAYYLSTSDFLTPISSEGLWSLDRIEKFYASIIDEYFQNHHQDIRVNPWPEGHTSALSISFNPEGNISQYKFVHQKLQSQSVKPTYVVNGILNDSIKSFLINQKANLISAGYNYINYGEINYAESVNDLLRNESKWQYDFKGFRFPFTNPTFFGLLATDLHQYQYESGITVNNMEFLHGSVFPYHLVISKDNFYKSTDILEISPTYYDDYYFLHSILDNPEMPPKELEKLTALHRQYLLDFWQYTVKPYNGLMVYLGHPGLTGFNKQTFASLDTLLETAQKDNAWLASMEEIKNFRNGFEKISVFTEKNKDAVKIVISAPKDVYIKGFSVNVNSKPGNIELAKGKAKIKKQGDYYSIIFDAFDGQEVVLLVE